MTDERYDRSADMRLLELQREAMGVPRRVVGSTSYTDPDPIAEISKDDDDGFVQSGTILIASMDAQPRTALIAGALVTVSLSVVNDGDTAAGDVRVNMALPADTAYRPGTAALDGAAATDEFALSLFDNGAPIGSIESGARRSLVVKLSVEAGVGDIILSPHLRAAGGAVLGFRAMRLTRARPRRDERLPARPFYESDDEENAAEPQARRAAAPVVAVVQPRELPPAPAPPVAAPPIVRDNAIVVAEPPVQKTAPPKAPAPSAKAKPVKRAAAAPATAEKIAVPTLAELVADLPEGGTVTKTKSPLKPRTKTKAKAKDKNVAIAPTSVPVPVVAKIESVRSSGGPIPVEGRGGPILTVSFDRKRYATLSRLFSGPSLGMIAHYLLLNALAAKDALPGDGDADAIAAFVAHQEQLLSRALVSTRLGKTPLPDSVGADLPPFPGALTARTQPATIGEPPAGQITLVRALSPSEVNYLERAVSNDKAAPFLRTAQLFVGLCANDAATASPAQRRETQVALTAYAAFATAEIGRIFLRAKLSRTPSLFKDTDAAFDEAARTVLATLGRVIA